MKLKTTLSKRRQLYNNRRWMNRNGRFCDEYNGYSHARCSGLFPSMMLYSILTMEGDMGHLTGGAIGLTGCGLAAAGLLLFGEAAAEVGALALDGVVPGVGQLAKLAIGAAMVPTGDALIRGAVDLHAAAWRRNVLRQWTRHRSPRQ
jgi:hypothetical protein